jgi:hypothetical protein
MGGFIILHTGAGEDRTTVQAAVANTFARMGFPAPVLIQGPNYILTLFPKRQANKPALQQFENGDFAFTCGTLIYDNKVGGAAAAAFHRDYKGSPEPRSRALGHYAVILRKDGVTQIIPDSFGGFHVFYDAAKRIASSSFFAVASVLDRVTLGRQSACEYIVNGVISGNATMFQEISVAPLNATIAVRGHSFEIVRHPVAVPTIVSADGFGPTVERSMELLDRYFAAIRANFGDRVTCALSGGYDSRLILAFLRRHGVRPSVYVYGPRGDKDVAIARMIARGEGFALEVVDKDQRRTVGANEFGAVAHANFLSCDGYSWDGIFDNGAERDERARRASGNAIVLNGGGGEIWRNFFFLLNRTYRPREILWSFYSQFDPETCTAAFDEETYFRELETKLAALIGEQRLLARPLVEWLYHSFRCRAWDGRVNTIYNNYGYVALTFLERPLTELASAIPFGLKNHGAYEADLIRRADPRLEAYP